MKLIRTHTNFVQGNKITCIILMGLEKSGKPRLSRKPIYETHPDSFYFLNTVHSRTGVISRPFGVLNSNLMDHKFLLF